jgi:hypothetical protein
MAGPEVPLIPDNERLPECADLGRFTANLLQPSLSRKMYQPGRKHGYLVYGLGGPRILVSHPFRGSTSALYDMYTNASDVYTSLALAGYTGSFLFLDLLPGLNAEVHGLPGWLLWFSKIAVHSDLVLFVTEGDGGLSPSQILESRYTPDRVLKKVVNFPAGEFRWAEQIPDLPVEWIIGADGKLVEPADDLAFEAEYSRPFVDGYLRTGIPADGLVRLDEDGSFVVYPPGYPVYGT